MPPQRITRELLLKRAEHNDGDLSTLREITLHQFDLEKIEALDVYCRKLQILYLQNNQISKIENVNKLKELDYLNLALNNITKIENLEGCESLRKLDLTVNFIDDLFCVESLIPCESLRELFLTGNPMTQKPGYREFVICTLPQLTLLDGVPIDKSERLRARQRYLGIKAEAAHLPIAVPPQADADALAAIDATPVDQLTAELQQGSSDHTPAARLTAARQLAKIRADKDPNKPKPKRAKAPLARIGPDGRVLQCNEVKYDFCTDETPHVVRFAVAISKFVDTSLIDAQVFDEHVRVQVREKLLQVRFDVPVDPSRVVAQRSQATGALVLYIARPGAPVGLDALQLYRKWEKEVEKVKAVEKAAADAAAAEAKAASRAVPSLDAKVVPNEGQQRSAPVAVAAEDWEDDPDVPPLV
ncbi:hypothetical protein AMAG_08247 [Allomyces macrogynus ATCC 38327]|uniref:Dynein axonemal assembly factor 11-like CS domain-containing protein n=1 Tax=Allomyces macrogynus (strain ATCC 38327) TaxID=578462 RepID=A0A0L0SKK4_ALLM3|nr:hypothetical protein AMAG_08247 [Allomyces macrogynus ATCC 38327]|eukprot:KNE63081.1 hypothetical protein AMAG_08247 [Allomyces macrogynus ATCC 38327]